MTERRTRPEDADLPTLAPREEAALADSVRPVAARGRGMTIASALIVLAFVAGLVRPWDLLTDNGSATPPEGSVSGQAVEASGGPVTPTDAPGTTGGPDGSGLPGIEEQEPATPACGYPTDWRSATVQTWAGRVARVWSAVDVQPASGPADPAIAFNVVAGEDFMAIGWCAPVAGDERPPVGARGRLFGIDLAGGAVELPFTRREPTAATALGELWVPAGQEGRDWALGRYVIELVTPDRSWVRYLGLDLRTTPGEAAQPSGTPSARPTASGGPPTSTPVSPAPTPGQSD